MFTWPSSVWDSCYNHNQVGSIPLSYCYNIFPWLCARCVCYIIFCRVLHIYIYILGNRDFVFIIIAQFMMRANQINQNQSIIELIKCLSGIFCRVCKIKHILSFIHYTKCGAVCFQFTHFPCDDWEDVYILSCYHHQIGSMYTLSTV